MENCLLLATDHGAVVCRHRDGDWMETARSLCEHRVRSVSAAGGVILAGTTRGLSRSADLGRTWHEPTSNVTIPHVRWLAHHAGVSGLALAGTESAAIHQTRAVCAGLPFTGPDPARPWRWAALCAPTTTGRHGDWPPAVLVTQAQAIRPKAISIPISTPSPFILRHLISCMCPLVADCIARRTAGGPGSSSTDATAVRSGPIPMIPVTWSSGRRTPSAGKVASRRHMMETGHGNGPPLGLTHPGHGIWLSASGR